MENEEKKTSFIEQYKQSLKSMDTEETIDLLFYRPIGFAWAKLCAKIVSCFQQRMKSCISGIPAIFLIITDGSADLL